MTSCWRLKSATAPIRGVGVGADDDDVTAECRVGERSQVDYSIAHVGADATERGAEGLHLHVDRVRGNHEVDTMHAAVIGDERHHALVTGNGVADDGRRSGADARVAVEHAEVDRRTRDGERRIHDGDGKREGRGAVPGLRVDLEDDHAATARVLVERRRRVEEAVARRDRSRKQDAIVAAPVESVTASCHWHTHSHRGLLLNRREERRSGGGSRCGSGSRDGGRYDRSGGCHRSGSRTLSRLNCEGRGARRRRGERCCEQGRHVAGHVSAGLSEAALGGSGAGQDVEYLLFAGVVRRLRRDGGRVRRVDRTTVPAVIAGLVVPADAESGLRQLLRLRVPLAARDGVGLGLSACVAGGDDNHHADDRGECEEAGELVHVELRVAQGIDLVSATTKFEADETLKFWERRVFLLRGALWCESLRDPFSAGEPACGRWCRWRGRPASARRPRWSR